MNRILKHFYDDFSPNVYQVCEHEKEVEEFVKNHQPPMETTSGFGGMVWRQMRRYDEELIASGIKPLMNEHGCRIYLPEDYNHKVFLCGMRYAFMLLSEEKK